MKLKSNPNLFELVMLLHNATSLLNKEQNLESAKALNFDNFNPDGNLMFGTGICTRKNLSAGIPIDILTYFLVAKLIQDNFPGISIYNILPDAHAEQNQFPTSEIKQISDSYEKQLNAIANALKMQRFYILRASQYSQDEKYVEILSTMSHIENSYIRRQIADVKYLHKYYDVDKKIGWCSKTRTSLSMDEPFFDHVYKETFPNSKVWFLYLEPGKRLSNKGMDVIPYTMAPFDKSSRIVLGQKKKIREFIEEIGDEVCSKQNKAAYRNYLKKIARVYNTLFPNSFGGKFWEDRLDGLNDMIYQLTNNKNSRSFIF